MYISSKPIYKIISAVLSLILIVYIFNSLYQDYFKHIKQPAPPLKSSSTIPMRLIIPAINVNAKVEQVGVTDKGDMDVPSTIMNVGWYKLGPTPGEIGSAVLAGHFDGKNGEPAVFAELDKLKKGDKVYIEDDKGGSLTFVVIESRTYDPGHADEIFTKSGKAYLNLITCDGTWDKNKKSYSKRLVVFTEIFLY